MSRRCDRIGDGRAIAGPPQEGDIVGELIVSAPGTPDKRIPVAAGKAVNELGLLGKAMAGLIGMSREGAFGNDENVLFLHTGGAPALHAYEAVLLGRA